MVDFRPFRGWRPITEKAAEVAAVPYDVVDTAEARALVKGAPDSLLRVTRPDVDLPDGTSLYGEAAYGGAKAAFARLLDAGVIVQDATPGYYAYAQSIGDHHQVGIVGLASADDYRADRIKKHEHTRPKKEDDRKRHIEAVRAHLGPVFLAFRARGEVAAVIEAVCAKAPEVDFTGPDDVRHQVWPIFESDRIATLEKAFAAVPALYIADGHHRAAAATRVGEGAAPDAARGRFLAVAFPHDALSILPYNRVVGDLNGHDPKALVTAIADRFVVSQLDGVAAPDTRRTFTMWLDGAWYRLTPRDAILPDEDDPVARLDVSILQDHLLGPILGIGNPRTDERIAFVGGVRGLAELEKRAGATGGVAFAMFPTSLTELMDIADAGEVMPPKSTWFEPKLRSGLIVSRY